MPSQPPRLGEGAAVKQQGSETMNSDTIKGDWKQMRGQVKEAFGKLTDDDLMVAAGNTEQLTGAIQKRYGYTREQAAKEWAAFTKRTAGAGANTAGVLSGAGADTATTARGAAKHTAGAVRGAVKSGAAAASGAAAGAARAIDPSTAKNARTERRDR